ncbi:tripeptidyl-peptidase [Aureococcus anophagefferens]|nr:tripeptidyl-peptidase [Aureococcus anophagefferens]
MKGWQAAAGFLGVGTVISLLSLIGDTTSYDETKYKVAGHWADTTTETATVGGKRSKQASSDDGDDFVGENDGGTKLPPNAPSFKSKQGGRSTDDDGDDFVGENDGGTKLPPNAPSFKSKQGRSTDDEGDDFVGENDGGTKLPRTPSFEVGGGRSADDDDAFAGENDGGSKVPPAIHHLLDTAYLDELPSATTQQQNILLILADDMGYNDAGYQSTDLGAATPTLDSLASRGLLRPPLGATLMSEVLKGRGYATHIVGKWNLGHASEAYLPHRRGFDSFIGYVGDQETYFSHEAYGTDPNNGTSYCDLMRSNSVDGVKVGECYLDEYSTDLYARRLVDVVGEHATTSDSPLFLYFAAQAPHAPLEEPPPMNATAPQEAMLAALVGAGDSWGKRRTFAKMVMNLDNNVRKVVDALAAAKLLQNTVVAFASDNGGCPRDGGSNWPLRGTKFSQYEGGVRVPAFLWSSTLQKRGAGTVFEGLFHAADWFSTLVAPAASGRPSTSYLFNLANDKNESVDVRSDRPDIYAKMVAKLRVYYDDAAKSAWKPEGKEAAYANWRAADNFVVPWVGNVLTLADSPTSSSSPA